MAKRNSTNNPHGRPPKYKAEFARIAKQILSIGGTDADLAVAFGVNVTTIWRWKAAHPAFLQAYKEGAAFSDDRVEASFYRRAVGYERKAVKILSYEGRSWEHDYIEEVPPDPRAGEFWLRNRRPDRWKDASSLKRGWLMTTRSWPSSKASMAP